MWIETYNRGYINLDQAYRVDMKESTSGHFFVNAFYLQGPSIPNSLEVSIRRYKDAEQAKLALKLISEWVLRGEKLMPQSALSVYWKSEKESSQVSDG